jgi:hypothetical protein
LNTTLAVIGLVFVGAAVVGGGLKALGIEVPLLASRSRQLLLAVVGAVAFVVALVAPQLNSGNQGSSKASLPPSGDQPPQQTLQSGAPAFSSSMDPGSIKITQVYDQVPRCTTFSGEGNVPANKNLWLAIFSDNAQKYFFRPVTVNGAQHSWIATNVTIGSKDSPTGSRYTIYAVLVDNDIDQQLRQGRFAGGIAALPPNFHKVYQIEVRRGGDSAECK